MVQVTPNPGLPEQTIISQYSTSPTIVQLINNMDAYINPDADFDAFFDFCFNVDTAQGFGLDNWGTIVNVSRQLTIPGDATNLGFKEGLNYQPFGQAPFYNGTPDTNTYTLVDSAYRTLILVKALANISNCTAPSLNQLLQNLFAGRGRCYVSDTGGIHMRSPFSRSRAQCPGLRQSTRGFFSSIYQRHLALSKRRLDIRAWTRRSFSMRRLCGSLPRAAAR
jgi:hypothetical protein